MFLKTEALCLSPLVPPQERRQSQMGKSGDETRWSSSLSSANDFLKDPGSALITSYNNHSIGLTVLTPVSSLNVAAAFLYLDEQF